jgi:hypothetical protein
MMMWRRRLDWFISKSGGKPITPTGDHALLDDSQTNGTHEVNGNITSVVDGATKLEVCSLKLPNLQISNLEYLLGVAAS